MLTTEWDIDLEFAVREQEAREIGREAAMKDVARALIKKGGIGADEIASLTGLDLNTVLHLQGE